MDFTATDPNMVELEIMRRWADDRAEIERRLKDRYLIVPSINGGDMYPASELSRFGL
jgi:hypothetical protein